MASLLDPVRTHIGTRPDGVAIRQDDLRVTYQELLVACRQFAGMLLARGLTPGDRVVLIAPTVPEFVVAYLGIQAAGCVVVPMNTMATSDEIAYVLSDSDAALIIAWHENVASAAKAAEIRAVPLLDLGPRCWEGNPAAELVERGLEATAAILYTSGTTGPPKGAEITVGNILSSARLSVQVSGGTTVDRIGTGLPLFHIFGQISVMMGGLTSGGSLTLVSPFEPGALVAAIGYHRLTIVAGVPTMWNAMLRLPPVGDDATGEGRALSSVRLAVSGGAALPGPVADAFEDRFGCELLEGYGMTETTSLGTFNAPGTVKVRGSAGTPVPGVGVEVRGRGGKAVPAGTVGEVFISGPTVMKGYWRRPEATAEALQGGWLKTGDLGRFDDDGNLFIVDRVKDLIIRGGYNVYPGEVEQVLYAHPDIIEAAVVGVPDEHYGEEVAAAVVVRPASTITGAEVTAWARERLSAYKIPRLVCFVDSLPKGTSGKILKRSIDVAIFR